MYNSSVTSWGGRGSCRPNAISSEDMKSAAGAGCGAGVVKKPAAPTSKEVSDMSMFTSRSIPISFQCILPSRPVPNCSVGFVCVSDTSFCSTWAANHENRTMVYRTERVCNMSYPILPPTPSYFVSLTPSSVAVRDIRSHVAVVRRFRILA